MEHISWWRDWAFPFCSWVQSVSKLECGWRYSFHGTKYLRVVLRKTILNSKLITLNFGWSKRKYGGTISQHFRKAQRCWHYWAPLRHQIQKKNLPKNRLSGTDMFFPSTKVPTHQQKIHPNVGFETTSLRVPPRHITLFKNLHQPISSTFGNNYIGVFGKSRSGFDVETQQTFHLMTSKGKNRKSVSLVIFCFVPIFWRLDMFGVSSWNHIEHVPSQLQRSPRLLFECSFDHTCYFHVYSTFHVCIYTSNISKYVYILYSMSHILYISHTW